MIRAEVENFELLEIVEGAPVDGCDLVALQLQHFQRVQALEHIPE